MKRVLFTTILIVTLIALCGCQLATSPKVTDAPDTPAVIDTLPPEITEAPHDSETFPPATDTTESATTIPEDTTAPTKENALLNSLLEHWEKVHNTKHEKAYQNDKIAIASRYYSNPGNHLCMLAYYNDNGGISIYSYVRVKDGWMQSADPAVYDHITAFEEAFNFKITTYIFTDQKLLMSVKNNYPNNVESFEVNDFAGKYIIKVVDGVIFNENATELILFPPGRTGSYTVPDGVTKIADGAFNYSKLSEVILPASVTELGTAFDNAVNVKIIQANNN